MGQTDYIDTSHMDEIDSQWKPRVVCQRVCNVAGQKSFFPFALILHEDVSLKNTKKEKTQKKKKQK